VTDFNTMNEHLQELLEERGRLFERIHELESLDNKVDFESQLWRELCDRMFWVIATEVRGNGKGFEIAPKKEFPTSMRIAVSLDYGYLHNGMFEDYLSDEVVATRKRMEKKDKYIPFEQIAEQLRQRKS